MKTGKVLGCACSLDSLFQQAPIFVANVLAHDIEFDSIGLIASGAAASEWQQYLHGGGGRGNSNTTYNLALNLKLNDIKNNINSYQHPQHDQCIVWILLLQVYYDV
jgi:hypothetical protein